MRKSTITVGIIARNEEANIGECIQRVMGWADEVVVIDGYSQDRTVEIARRMGANVFQHKFQEDFSIERNMVMDNATGDWVLHLDADDRVTEGFKKRFNTIADHSSDLDVLKFRRKNFFLGRFMKHGGWYHYIPNLVRRGKVRFEGALHERPVYVGKIGILDEDVEHHPFQTISKFVYRHNRYSSIEAENMYSKEGKAKLDQVKKQAVRKTLKIFWKTYVKKKGYKEGMHGLVFAVLFSFTNFLIWAKYWELCRKDSYPNT